MENLLAWYLGHSWPCGLLPCKISALTIQSIAEWWRRPRHYNDITSTLILKREARLGGGGSTGIRVQQSPDVQEEGAKSVDTKSLDHKRLTKGR